MSYTTNFLNTIRCCDINGTKRYSHYPSRFFRYLDALRQRNFDNTDCCIRTDGYIISNNDNNYVISLDVPGVAKENLKIEIQDNDLVIKTEYSNTSDGNDKSDNEKARNYHYAFNISDDIEKDAIDVVLKQGILTITLPKKEQSKPQKLEVKEIT